MPAASCSRRTGIPAASSALASRRQLGVRAGQHGDGAGAHVAGVERAHDGDDQRGLVVLVVGAEDPHGRSVAARRRRRPLLSAGPQHGDAGARRPAACSGG